MEQQDFLEAEHSVHRLKRKVQKATVMFDDGAIKTATDEAISALRRLANALHAEAVAHDDNFGQKESRRECGCGQKA